MFSFMASNKMVVNPSKTGLLIHRKRGAQETNSIMLDGLVCTGGVTAETVRNDH